MLNLDCFQRLGRAGIQHRIFSKTQAEYNEQHLVLVLAAIQFTFVLYFIIIIIMPLGPQFMSLFELSALSLGLPVSCYSISAAIASLTVAFVADRFGRRTLLIVA